MRICHCCLSSFYIDDTLYQENELVQQHVMDGHDVSVLASTETYASDGSITYTAPGKYIGSENALVIRLPYRNGLPHRIASKLRMHPGVYALLESLAPDVILFHGSAGWELLTVSRYVRNHPNCNFFIDSHTDANNSAKGWLSRSVLHRQLYRRILLRAMDNSGPLLCVSTEVMDFAAEVYGIPRDRLEFFPLGGHPPGDSVYGRLRASGRERLGLAEDDILLVQSGKQSACKRLIETLEAFAQSTASHLRLAITGVLQEDIRAQAEALIRADKRVTFLGWKKPDELTELLCAADVYVQPGTQSATMQQSLCCRCAVILADVPAHDVYQQNNGWFVSDKNGLRDALAEVVTADLVKMSNNSYRFAQDHLDYSVLAQRVLRRSGNSDVDYSTALNERRSVDA